MITASSGRIAPETGHDQGPPSSIRRRLDQRVGARVDEPGLAVVELHQVGRRSLIAVHLDDLAVLVRVPHDVAVNADAVANRRLHVRTSSSRAVPTGWRLPAYAFRTAMQSPAVASAVGQGGLEDLAGRPLGQLGHE